MEEGKEGERRWEKGEEGKGRAATHTHTVCRQTHSSPGGIWRELIGGGEEKVGEVC